MSSKENIPWNELQLLEIQGAIESLSRPPNVREVGLGCSQRPVILLEARQVDKVEGRRNEGPFLAATDNPSTLRHEPHSLARLLNETDKNHNHP